MSPHSNNRSPTSVPSHISMDHALASSETLGPPAPPMTRPPNRHASAPGSTTALSSGKEDGQQQMSARSLLHETKRRISLDRLATEIDETKNRPTGPTPNNALGNSLRNLRKSSLDRLESEVAPSLESEWPKTNAAASLRRMRAGEHSRQGGPLGGSGTGGGGTGCNRPIKLSTKPKPGIIQRNRTAPASTTPRMQHRPSLSGATRRNASHTQGAFRRGSALRMAPSQPQTTAGNGGFGFLGSLGSKLRLSGGATVGDSGKDPLTSSTHSSSSSSEKPSAQAARSGGANSEDLTVVAASEKGGEHRPAPTLSRAMGAAAATLPGRSNGTKSHPNNNKGTSSSSRSCEFRHEALEELASNVRDLRAEVHGRPSLCERRFSSLRRSRSCGNLIAEIGGMRGMLESLVEEENKTLEETGRLTSPAAARTQSILRRGAGFRRPSSAARRSVLFVDKGRVRASQTGPLLAAAAKSAAAAAAASGGNNNGSASFLAMHDSKNSLDGTASVAAVPKGAFSHLSPHSAAVASIESVYSLVSALYGLSDSLTVAPAVAGGVLDLTHNVDLAFGRIKPIISSLAFESDFDCGGAATAGNHAPGGGGLDCTERSALSHLTYDETDEDSKCLIRALASVSDLIDAMSETVRKIADDPASQNAPMTTPSGRSNSVPQGKLNPELFCAYVTFLELLGMKCDEVQHSDYLDDVLGGSGAGVGDYAAFLSGGGMAALHGGGGHDSMNSSVCSADIEGGGHYRRGSLTLGELDSSHREGFLYDDDDEADDLWEPSRWVRSAWENAGHMDKVVVLDGHRSAPPPRLMAPSRSAPTPESHLAASGVDPDLFRELSGMVLRGMEWSPERLDAVVAGLDDRNWRNIGSTTMATASNGKEKKNGSGCITLRKIQRGKRTDMHSAVTLCRLGDIRTSLWEYDDALAHYEEALRISRIAQGNCGPLVAGILEAAGNAYRLKGDLDQADLYFHEALSALKQSRQHDDAAAKGLLSLLLSWSRLRIDRGDTHDAIVTLGRRLDLFYEVHGPDHPEVGDTLFQRGSLQMDLGFDAEAEEDFTESLRVRMRAFGPDDEAVADALFTLGLLRCTSKDKDRALEFLWDALRIRRHHGTDRLKEADTLAVIGNIHRTMGQNETAVGLYGECLELRTEFLGGDNKKVADVHVALGYTHTELQEHREAAKHFRAALTIAEKEHGDKDKRVIHLLRYLGKAEFDAGNPLQAKIYLERCLHLKRETGQDKSIEYVDAMHVLGKIGSKMGDKAGSRETLRKAQMIYATNNHAARRLTVGKELLASLKDINDAGIDLTSDDEEEAEPEAEDSATSSVRSFFMGMQRSMVMENANASNGNALVAKETQRSMRIKNAQLAKSMKSQPDSCKATRSGEMSSSMRMSLAMMPGEHLWGSTEIKTDPCDLIPEEDDDEGEPAADKGMDAKEESAAPPTHLRNVSSSLYERIFAACNAEMGQ